MGPSSDSGWGILALTRSQLGFLTSRSAAARAAGAGELHLNGVLWGLPGTDGSSDHPEQVSASAEVVERLGFDSVTSYNWMQYAPMPELATDYGPYSQVAPAGWKRFVDNYPVPYLPNVSMGWDSSPRTVQSDEFAPLG